MTHHPQVYLIGSGPGPADLLTVRGAACLDSAQVVFCERGVSFAVASRAVCPVVWIADNLDACGQVEDAVQRGLTVAWLFAALSEQPMKKCALALKKSGIRAEVVPAVRARSTQASADSVRRHVLITRPRAQAKPFEQELSARGLISILMPTVVVRPLRVDGAFEQVLGSLGQYDWFVFTSVNAVDCFVRAVMERGDLRLLSAAQVAAIGGVTARRLLDKGLRADVVAEDTHAEGFLAALSEVPLAGKRILLPRAQKARDILPKGLRAHGADVTVLPVYRSELADAQETAVGLAALRAGAIDVVSFTSGSTVSAFCRLLGDERAALMRTVAVASIGPVTSRSCREHGLTVAIESPKASTSALAEAIASYCKSNKRSL